MADYSMMGSFGSGGASALNGELIQKLKDAESKSKIKPIENKLETWDKEKAKIEEIKAKTDEFLASVKPFDLYNSGSNAFSQVTASTTGESAVFDASDVGALKPGITKINITQLAQKDVYQSDILTVSGSDPVENKGPDDVITDTADSKITINGHDYGTAGVTYKELVTTINNWGEVSASLEKVSDTEYRLVIKSNEPGKGNALLINEQDSGLGLDNDSNDDGTANDFTARTQAAQNLEATIDGVSYNVSSNSIMIDGNLKITATKLGESSISVQKDDSSIVPAIENMALKYNELLVMITEELYSAEPSVEDTSTLKSMLSGIKNLMYDKYGDNDDKSLFNNGFSFDKQGLLSIDKKILGKALTEDQDAVKNIFIGTAENPGFGTVLKEHLADFDSFNGLFSSYKTSMDDRKKTLEENKEKETKALDTKYATMASQFAAYGAMITQMESAFSGLKSMIAQSENGS